MPFRVHFKESSKMHKKGDKKDAFGIELDGAHEDAFVSEIEDPNEVLSEAHLRV